MCPQVMPSCGSQSHRRSLKLSLRKQSKEDFLEEMMKVRNGENEIFQTRGQYVQRHVLCSMRPSLGMSGGSLGPG